MRIMRIPLTALAGLSVLVLGAASQSPPPQQVATTPVGTWRGISLCLVRPSACKDEVVIYRISHTKADSMTLDARKIVNGEEQEMGVLACRFTSPNGPLVCVFPRGTWKFHVRSDSLVGELRLVDDTKFRDVRTARVR
jgi:hypothetical protein